MATSSVSGAQRPAFVERHPPSNPSYRQSPYTPRSARKAHRTKSEVIDEGERGTEASSRDSLRHRSQTLLRYLPPSRPLPRPRSPSLRRSHSLPWLEGNKAEPLPRAWIAEKPAQEKTAPKTKKDSVDMSSELERGTAQERILAAIQPHMASPVSAAQALIDVVAVLLSETTSGGEALEALNAIRMVFSAVPALKEAVSSMRDPILWNDTIIRFFRLSPRYFPVLMDSIPYWNRLEAIDLHHCLHEPSATRTVVYHKSSTGVNNKTITAHIPQIMASDIPGYDENMYNTDTQAILPLIERLVHRSRRSIAVGPVIVGHKVESSFPALAIMGVRDRDLSFCLQQIIPTTTHPVIYLPGRVTVLSDGELTREERLKRLVSGNLTDEKKINERKSTIGAIKISIAEALQEDVDIGRSTSRSDCEDKGTIGGIVRVEDEILCFTANHVFRSGPGPAEIGAGIMVPASLELLKFAHQLGIYDWRVDESQKKERGEKVLVLHNAKPHGEVRFGRIGRDEEGVREDWALFSISPSHEGALCLRNDSVWSNASKTLLQRAFYPDSFTSQDLKVTTTGRRDATAGEIVAKLGAQGGASLGRVGGDLWRTYYARSWHPYFSEEDLLDDDEEEEGLEEGEAVEGVEWCSFTSISSLARDSGFGMSGDSGCRVAGASQNVDPSKRLTREGFLGSINDGNGVSFVGELVTVVNSGALGSIGLMVKQSSLFSQMSRGIGKPVELVR
ncbi:hypothetical protein BJ508DRAFT_302551 [Ascobolus immersus RN42]|uniref:Uncharacterized protein n=1 Tax=Ascobolus immersus RN42 TaxID=1160509 RepID=A0A3N4IVS3_ASCIM|nr:hypothetical protein BJ508DRAFT_302551 [Ascobolus immersus RN42]